MWIKLFQIQPPLPPSNPSSSSSFFLSFVFLCAISHWTIIPCQTIVSHLIEIDCFSVYAIDVDFVNNVCIVSTDFNQFVFEICCEFEIFAGVLFGLWYNEFCAQQINTTKLMTGSPKRTIEIIKQLLLLLLWVALISFRWKFNCSFRLGICEEEIASNSIKISPWSALSFSGIFFLLRICSSLLTPFNPLPLLSPLLYRASKFMRTTHEMKTTRKKTTTNISIIIRFVRYGGRI